MARVQVVASTVVAVSMSRHNKQGKVMQMKKEKKRRGAITINGQVITCSQSTPHTACPAAVFSITV